MQGGKEPFPISRLYIFCIPPHGRILFRPYRQSFVEEFQIHLDTIHISFQITLFIQVLEQQKVSIPLCLTDPNNFFIPLSGRSFTKFKGTLQTPHDKSLIVFTCSVCTFRITISSSIHYNGLTFTGLFLIESVAHHITL